MSEEINKTIIGRIWEDGWQEGNLAIIHKLIGTNHVVHAYPEDLRYGAGVEGFKRLLSTNRANLLDGQLAMKGLITEDDKIGIYGMIGVLDNIFISRKFRTMFQDPPVRIDGALGQSFGCFIVYKASNCLTKG